MARGRGPLIPQLRKPPGGGASQLDSAAAGGEGEPEGSQRSEIVELSEASEGASGRETAPAAPGNVGQATAEAPLSHDEPRPVAGEVRVDGFVYSVNPDGASVALVGWYGDAPTGDVSVPARIAVGETSFAVVALGDSSGEGLFADAPVASLSIPALVDAVADGALSGCPTLSRVSVSSENQTYASFDGMLFSKDLSDLLLVPEGKEGAARIPDPATSVPAGAFSRAPGLCEAVVGEGSAVFSSRDGLLYTKDMNTLVACPVGAGDAVVVPEGVASVASGAFAGCPVASVTALGFVCDIAADAFDPEARECAVVALPAGDDYEARKAVWEAAGFGSFKEPAKPGDVSQPEPSEPEGGDGSTAPQASGLVYEVLDDYTLAVSWQGPEGPEGTLEIPATAEVGGVSYRVSAVADAAFAGRSGLTGVALPASVATVGDRAFEATGVSDVWLPASVATVGERAFAACASLERVVALGTPWVADSALAECSGVSVYAPSDSDNPWNVGLPAAGNHLMPYGVALPEEPLALEVGQSSSIIEGGQLDAPDPVEASYSYAAKPLSVDPDGTATGKAEGSSEVAVTLSLDDVELARATRTVEVAAALESEVSDVSEALPVRQGIIAMTIPLTAEILPGYSALDAKALADEEAFTSSDGVLTFTALSSDAGMNAVSVKLTPGRSPKHVDIPAMIEHDGVCYAVTEVSTSGFADATSIESVILPETLTVIGPNAFIRCASLRSVTIPASVETIFNGAFNSNVALAELSFAQGSRLRSIGMSAFSGTALTRVTFPASLEELGSHAFRIASLSEVSFEEGSCLKKIAAQCFQDCAELSSIVLPASVKEVLNAAFANTGLREVRFSSQSSLEILQAGAFAGCPLTSIAIPASVKTMASQVFMSCESLESVSFGEGSLLENIGAQCFQGCTSLKAIEIPESVKKLGDSSFANCSQLMRVELEKQSALETIANYAFANCTALCTFVVPDSVTTIAQRAFYGCLSLTAAKIGSGVASLPALVFSGCSSLSSVYATDSVTSVDSLAFDEATKRNALVFLATPDKSAFDAAKVVWRQAGFAEANITEAGGTLATTDNADNARWSLDAGGTLRIECTRDDTVIKSMGWTEADHASGGWAPVRGFVKSVDIDASVEAENMDWWFADMVQLEQGPSFSFPASVKSVTGLFYGCMSLEGLPDGFSVPDAVGRIGNMFMGCSSLRTLPDGFAIPRGSADSPLLLGVLFMDCVSLERLPESFVFPEGAMTEVVSGMFRGCSSLEELPSGFRFPDVVKKADGTFYGCSSLRSLPEGFSLPSALTVSKSMFKGCSSLASLPTGFDLPPSLLDAFVMFSGCSSLSSLPEGFTVPENRGINVEKLFEGCSSLSSLPASFRIPVPKQGVVRLNNLFDGCTSLASLPEGLAIPSELDVSGIKGLFRNCPSLTSLPAGFSFPADWARMAVDAGESPFACEAGPDGARVPTYYAGDDPTVLGYDWEADNRTLVTDPADMGEWGMRQVKLRVQSADEVAGFPWETRTVAWTDKQGVLADPGNLQLDGYKFTGWCTDEACLEPADFTKPLPVGVDTLYGKWAKHGGRGTAEGMLPVESPDGTPAASGMSAWWSITADGAFNIKCEGGASVGELRMTWNDDGKKFWEPYANEVRSLSMHGDVKARSMVSWFKNMRNLEDVRDGFFITENCALTTHLFYNDFGLKYLPEGIFPGDNDIVDIWGMFQGCTALEELPADFAVPSKVGKMGCLFYNARSLKCLPESFELHEGIKNMDEAFYGCSSLRTLPEGFAIPKSVESAGSAFANCPSLAVLPAGLLSKLSDSVKNMINRPHVSQSNDSVGLFGLSGGVVSDALPTYFPAPAGQQALVDWAAQRRELVTDIAASGQALVELWLPNEGGSGFYLRESLMVVQGTELDAPIAPERLTSTFVGWYTDESLNTPATFPLTVSSDTPLYAKYQANSGPLPTTDGYDRASWKLDSDGTLVISCEPDATIADLGWSRETYSSGYWGPLRSRIQRVEMADDVRVGESMAFWFAYCSNLKELPESFMLHEGIEDVTSLFDNCSSLEKLPSRFTLPSTVTAATCLLRSCKKIVSLPANFALPDRLWDGAEIFSNCTSLESVPAGVVLPEGVGDVHSLFYQCYKLKSLPSGFTIPKSATLTRNMFFECRSLESLPQGFAIPDDCVSSEYRGMFYGCQSLKALPEGFTLPLSGRNFNSMFWRCNSLTSLPASLDLSRLSPEATFVGAFTFSVVGGGYTVTRYAGSDPSKLLPSGQEGTAEDYWKANFNRELVTSVPAGTHAVTFMLQRTGEAAPSAWQTVLVDEGAALQRPADPYAFGYRFGGWKLRGADGSLADYDFGAPVASDLVLAGTLAMEVDVDVPIQAKATVDAAGAWSPGEVEFRSLTPATVRVAGVSGELAPHAGELFPSGAEKVGVKATFGRASGAVVPGSPDPAERSVGLSASLAPAAPGAPSLLPCSIAVEPNGAQVRYQPGDGMTSFARLSWTIEVAVP